MGFRYKSSIPVSRERQRKIWEVSRAYDRLAFGLRSHIDALCRVAGGHNADALLEFVTSDTGATAICVRRYLSHSTLCRAVRRYYILADREKLWRERP